jgi:hypothetical protein
MWYSSPGKVTSTWVESSSFARAEVSRPVTDAGRSRTGSTVSTRPATAA